MVWTFRRRGAGGRRRAAAIRARLRRKRLARGRIGRFRQTIQYFKRSSYTPNWVQTSNVADVFKNLTVTLNGLPSSSEFTNLYDQYKIRGVKFTLIPRFNVAQATDGNTAPFQLPSQIYSVLDFDGNFPVTINDMFQYENLKMSRGTALHKRYFKPAVLPQVFNGITTGYSISKNMWIDCQNDAIPHYGSTICIPQVNATEPLGYDLKVDLYVAFKNVR